MDWSQDVNGILLPPQVPQQQQDRDLTEVQEPLCRRKTFYVHPKVPMGCRDQLVGHMYVESLQPETTTQPYPLILIHGDFHTGKIWLDKPDGNPGWAAYFLKQGYHVYIVDLPAVGRSAKDPSVSGGNMPIPCFLNPQKVERELTCPRMFCEDLPSAWDSVRQHKQWPGVGLSGDPVFTQYMASTTVIETNRWQRQTQGQEALSGLLERTGKAILVGEGTGCIMAWLATDVMFDLVAGVLCVEPAGPPFGSSRGRNNRYCNRPVFDPEVREWGLADIPLTYDPPVAKPEEIIPDPEVEKRGSPLFDLCEYIDPEDSRKSCFLQNPIRVSDSKEEQGQGQSGQGKMVFHQLIHLKKVPHAVITAESSSHSIYDWATVSFMRQAGLQVRWFRLENLDIRGNGRLMFLEKNSDEIALVIHKWVARLPAVMQQQMVIAKSAPPPKEVPVLEPRNIPTPAPDAAANGVQMENPGPLGDHAVQHVDVEAQHHQIEGGWQFV